MVDFIGTNANNATLGGYDDQYGAGGDDLLRGDATGKDLYGGSGNDILLGGGSSASGSGTEQDPIIFTTFQTSPNNVIEGGSGDDVLYGAGGDDVLYGGSGNDSGVVQIGGGEIPGSFFYKAGIYGGDGDDSLYGGKGNDLLDGGLGKDHQYGGQDADTFVFNDILDSSKKKSLADVIHDFEHKLDKIDLSGIDANETKAGDQDFDYIKKKKFSDEAGELRYKKGYLMGDTDGDGKKDFAIKVETDLLKHGDYKLTGSDLIL